MQKIIFFLLITSLCISCSDQPNILNSSLQEIAGRDDGKESNGEYTRSIIYRGQLPLHWRRCNPSRSESIGDTTKPLCEFIIEDEGAEEVHITIHNFPTTKLEERIPPEAQIARWKRQFTELDLTTLAVIPQSYGGFAGLLFEGSGIQKEKHTTVIAWAMQLAPEHYSTLSFLLSTIYSSQKQEYFRQMRSDYTIKAVGPTALMKKHRQAILGFAHSFELIEEIPL